MVVVTSTVGAVRGRSILGLSIKVLGLIESGYRDQLLTHTGAG
jgi:hypothetical protein